MDNKTKIICTSKQVQIYEILNKIQNVINTESLLPRKFDFFQFRFSITDLKQATLVKKTQIYFNYFRVYLFCQNHGRNAQKMASVRDEMQGARE